ncbi:hypothetical protein GTR00_15290 [Kineococcus sp. T90]|nr:hypothetical protein [Kineococcus indalonis]
MPPGQPRGRTGDEPRTARSPLTLRLLLALFGLVVCGVLGALWLTAARPPGGTRGPGLVLVLLAVVALADVAVVAARLRRRRRG